VVNTANYEYSKKQPARGTMPLKGNLVKIYLETASISAYLWDAVGISTYRFLNESLEPGLHKYCLLYNVRLIMVLIMLWLLHLQHLASGLAFFPMGIKGQYN